MDLRELSATRLMIQRLAGPAVPDPAAAVRESLAVQSQDVPLALDSLAQRTRGDAAEARTALDAGAFVRTHVLRPTWHFVAAEDLRWLLALTSPKVLSGLTKRHADLGLGEPARRARLLDAVREALSAGPLTRVALGEHLTQGGLLGKTPVFGSQVSHVLLIGELEGLWCSGPVDPTGLSGHTYALLDDRLPPVGSLRRSREDALVELVGRFVASHGPVSVQDLQRWTRLTQRDVRLAVAALGDAVEPVEVAGHVLWCGACPMAERGPGSPAFVEARERVEGAWLLSTFDEAVLTHNTLRMPIPASAPHAGQGPRYSEAGGGPVLWNLTDVGVWKRVHRADRFEVTLRLDPSLPLRALAALDAEAHALAVRSGAERAVVTRQAG